MRVLVVGSEGFIGRNTMHAFAEAHEVYGASRNSANLPIDLLDRNSIDDILDKVKPDVIFNAAGIVGASDHVMDNVTFTANLLRSVTASGIPVKRIIITGSAAEYGVVDKKNIPVREDTPINADGGYALSKAEEVRIALKIAKDHNLPVAIARVFNPLGPGMHPRFLTSRILEQIAEIRQGQRDVIEVSRLDSRRDYVDVRDVGRAVVALAEHDLHEQIYNVGSGKSTSNGELIDFMVRRSKLESVPRVIETLEQREPLVAIQADIARIEHECGWEPRYKIEETIEGIINVSGK